MSVNCIHSFVYIEFSGVNILDCVTIGHVDMLFAFTESDCCGILLYAFSVLVIVLVT